jgi:hypothetical protein
VFVKNGTQIHLFLLQMIETLGVSCAELGIGDRTSCPIHPESLSPKIRILSLSNQNKSRFIDSNFFLTAMEYNVLISVLYQHRFDDDPDPNHTFHFDADPDQDPDHIPRITHF